MASTDDSGPPSGNESVVTGHDASPKKPPKKARLPASVPETIDQGRVLRIQKSQKPRQPARLPPKPAFPRGFIPNDRDVKMSRRDMMRQAACLRKHNVVLSDRLDELSKPTRRQLLALWRNYAYLLTPEQINNLQRLLEANDPFKPDQAYEYFMQLSKAKKKQRDKAGNKAKKKANALCGDRRFAWVRSATVAFARGIQRRLGRPGNYELEDGLLRLSDIVLAEICSYCKMKPPSRRNKHPKAKFMHEMSDKIAVWIDEILAESDERLLLMDFDEDDEVTHADEPFTDDFLNMMGGKGRRLLPPKPAYVKFSGDMLDAFKNLTDAMYKKGPINLVTHGKHAMSYKEGADDLRRAPDLMAMDYDDAVAKDIAKKMEELSKSWAAGDKNKEQAMKDIIDICSKYLAQEAEYNKDKGPAFKYLVNKMRGQPGEILCKKGKVTMTMGQGAEKLDAAKGLETDHDDPKLTREIVQALEKLVQDAPPDQKGEMRDTVELAAKYLSQNAADASERGPAFDKMVDILKKHGGKEFSPSHPYLKTAYQAAHALKNAPGLSSSTPDPAISPEFQKILHNIVDAETPNDMKQEMAEAIKKGGDYLSGFTRDRGKAQEILVQIMKDNQGKEIAKRNDKGMTYGDGAQEFVGSPVLSPILPVSDISKEVRGKLDKDVAAQTPAEIRAAMKGLTKDAAGDFSQDVALISGSAGERYARNLVAATAEARGDELMYKTGAYGMTYADAGQTLRNAGTLESSNDPRSAALTKEIAAKLKEGQAHGIAPATAARLDPMTQAAAAHLAKIEIEMNDALTYLLDTMNRRAEEPFVTIQGMPHTYGDCVKKVARAPTLTNDNVDRGTYETIRSKLKALMKDYPKAEYEKRMPAVIDDVAKFLAKPAPNTKAEEKELLADLLQLKESQIFYVDGKYKMTYKDAAAEVMKASTGGAAAAAAGRGTQVDPKKKREIEEKLQSVMGRKQGQLKELVDDAAHHLADVTTGRGQAMDAIYKEMEKKGETPLANYKDATMSYKEGAQEIDTTPHFSKKPAPPGLADDVNKKLASLPVHADTAVATMNMVANTIAAKTGQKGGYVPPEGSEGYKPGASAVGAGGAAGAWGPGSTASPEAIAKAKAAAGQLVVKKGVDMNALAYLLDTMAKRGDEPFATIQGLPHTYGDVVKKIARAPTLSNEKVDKDVFEKIKSKLNDLMKNNPNPEHEKTMPKVIEDVSKFLSRPLPTTKEEEKELLSDLLHLRESQIFDVEGKYKMTYGDAAKEIMKAPTGGAAAAAAGRGPQVDPAKKKEMEGKLQGLMEGGGEQLRNQLNEMMGDAAHHLADVSKGRGEAMGTIYKELEKKGDTPLATYNDATLTHVQGARTIDTTRNFTEKPTPPGLTEDVTKKLGALPVHAETDSGDKHMKSTMNMVANAIAAETGQKGGYVPPKDPDLFERPGATGGPGGRGSPGTMFASGKGQLTLKEGVDMNALAYLLDTMLTRGNEPFATIQGMPHTYGDAVKKIARAPTLKNDKVDKETFEDIRSKLNNLIKDYPKPEHEKAMPTLIDDVSRFLAKPRPSSKEEEKELLRDLLQLRESEIFATEGKYKMTYKDAAKEIMKAPTGVAAAAAAGQGPQVDQVKKKEMEGKIQGLMESGDPQLQNQMKGLMDDAAHHLTEVTKGRAEAMDAIHQELEKKGETPLAAYKDATTTHKEGAKTIDTARHFSEKPAPPGLTEDVTQKLTALSVQAGTTGGDKHMKSTMQMVANTIAAETGQKGGYVPPKGDYYEPGGIGARGAGGGLAGGAAGGGEFYAPGEGGYVPPKGSEGYGAYGAGGAGGGPGGYGGTPQEQQQARRLSEIRRRMAAGERGGVPDKEHADAKTLLINELRKKGDEVFFRVGPNVLTNAQAADVLEREPQKVNKGVRESPDTDQLARKFERKLGTIVEGATPAELRDAMIDIIVESARPLAERIIAQTYGAAAAEALIDQMQRKDQDLIAHKDGKGETYFYAAQRLKKTKEMTAPDPDIKLARDIETKLDEALKSRSLPGKLVPTMRDHTKQAADYLSQHVTIPDPVIDAFVDLLKEMQAAKDKKLVGGRIPKSHKDAAEYLKTLTSFEDKIRKEDLALQAEIENGMRELMANRPTYGKYTPEIRDQVIHQQAGLLTSYLVAQGEKIETLNKVTDFFYKNPNEMILRHGTARKTFYDAGLLLHGKNPDQLQNVRNVDAIVAKKINLRLNNVLMASDDMPFLNAVIDDVTKYLAVHLLRQKIIKICRCKKTAFVQCELWNEEILRRVKRPSCTCSQGRLPDDPTLMSTGTAIKFNECPTMATYGHDQPPEPCPGMQPCPGIANTYMVQVEQSFQPANKSSVTRLPPEPPTDPSPEPNNDLRPEPTEDLRPETTTSHIPGEQLPMRFKLEQQIWYSGSELFTEPSTDSQATQSEQTTSMGLTTTSTALPTSCTSLAESTTTATTHSSPRFRPTPWMAFAMTQDRNSRSCGRALSANQNRQTEQNDDKSESPIVTTDQMSDLYAMMVSLMWNMQAWRGWLQEKLDLALTHDIDQNQPPGEAYAEWVAFQKRVMKEALQWRQYIKFSQQLTKRLQHRYTDKQIVSPTRASNKTRAYLECQSEMFEITDMFNKWTQWLVAVLKECETLRPKNAYNLTSLHVLCWKHFKEEVEASLEDWTRYKEHLNVCWEHKYRTILSMWEQEGPVWVMSACGAVPSGAVSAGTYNDEIIWVARATHKSEVLPAALMPSKHCCLVYAEGAIHCYTKYQVLCNADVEWKAWRAGGRQDARAVCVAPGVHVGRVQYHAHYLVGAVLAPTYHCHVVIHNRPIAFECFELLVMAREASPPNGTN